MHSVAFHIGSLTVHWYGIMVALGFVAGLWTASRRGLREGVSAEKILDLGPWLIVGAIVGARILYVITFWREEFAADPFPAVFMVQRGGLVFYGGLIGATLGGILYARRKQLPLWKLADVIAPSIPLGSVFGRIGCLLYGCCYGSACTLPWAIHFPPDHPTYPNGVHPTEIYDALLNLALYGLLAWMFRHKKKFDGQVFATFLVGYALTRSFVELFRGDYPPDQHFLLSWVTPAHLVSLGILAAGLILWRLLPRPRPKQG